MSTFNADEESVAIRNSVELIQQFMQVPQMIELRKNDYKEYEKQMQEIFSTFYKGFECLFEMVIRGDNMETLHMMLNQFVKIHKGEISRDDGELAIGEHIAKNKITVNNKTPVALKKGKKHSSRPKK
jgi:hypothetical protein